MYVCVFVHIYIERETARERERLLYQNFRITANQKSTIDTQTKKNQFKYNTKVSHQTRKEENKRRRDEKVATKRNPKQLIKWQ